MKKTTMKKETMKIVYASVHRILNPKNPGMHEKGIVLIVREHEGLHSSHKGYLWFDIATAIDLELIPKDFDREDDDDKIDEHIKKYLIGETITEKVYSHHTLGKRVKELAHLKDEIAHFIAAFEMEMYKDFIIDILPHFELSKIKESEKMNKKCLANDLIVENKIAKLHDNVFLNSGLDHDNIYAIDDSKFRVEKPSKDIGGNIPRIISKESDNAKAKKIYQHYKKRIESVLKEIIELS